MPLSEGIIANLVYDALTFGGKLLLGPYYSLFRETQKNALKKLKAKFGEDEVLRVFGNFNNLEYRLRLDKHRKNIILKQIKTPKKENQDDIKKEIFSEIRRNLPDRDEESIRKIVDDFMMTVIEELRSHHELETYFQRIEIKKISDRLEHINDMMNEQLFLGKYIRDVDENFYRLNTERVDIGTIPEENLKEVNHEMQKDFYNRIKDIYELMGYSVLVSEQRFRQNDMILEYTIPGGLPIKAGVKCVCLENGLVNSSLIQHYIAILTSEEQTFQYTIIVTNLGFTYEAKTYAEKKNVKCITYFELLTSLIDFNKYLNKIIDNFEKRDPDAPSNHPPLQKYYVDLFAEDVENKNHKDLVSSYIFNWLGDIDNNSYVLFGEYGTGKTSFCKYLAHNLATKYKGFPTNCRIPIILKLRDFTKSIDIESLITSFLDRECEVPNPRYELFRRMNDAGLLFIMLDGFDEMAVSVNSETLKKNIYEIEKLAYSRKSKILLTTRPEHLVHKEEEEKIFHPNDPLGIRKNQFNRLKILNFNQEQINEFLQKRIPLVENATKDWIYYKNKMREIWDLSDLAKTPVLLDMIVITLPDLLESGEKVNRANLYQRYLTREIERQVIQKGRELKLTTEIRFELLEKLSIENFISERNSIQFEQAKDYIINELNPAKYEVEAFTRDFLTCSFLIREVDNYHFSHRSLMEYFAALSIANEINQNAPNFMKKGIIPITEPIRDFLRELNVNMNNLKQWIRNSKSPVEDDIKFLGTNSINIALKINSQQFIGENFQGCYLPNADFSDANLSNVNFTGADLSGVVINERSKFHKTNFSNAILKGVKAPNHKELIDELIAKYRNHYLI